MSKTKIGEFGETFFKAIDSYMEKKYEDMSCDEVYRSYADFVHFVKENREGKGSSSGFTGLSELLVLRFLIHLLGNDFDSKQIADGEVYKFVSKNNGTVLTHNAKVKKSKVRPDIVIYENEKGYEDGNPFAVIEIKTYLTDSFETFYKAIGKIERIRSESKNLKAAIINYDKLSEKGNVNQKIQDSVKQRNWLGYITLEENKKPLKEVLSFLELKKLAKKS